MKKTVLVTGCDGYIGFPLCLKLVKDGHFVVGVDNFSRRENVKSMGSDSAIKIHSPQERTEILKSLGNYSFHNYSVDSPFTTNTIFKTYTKPFDTVINLAQQPSAPWSHKSHFHTLSTINNNVNGVINLLYAIKKFAPNAHLIHIGTMGEYDPTVNVPIPEGFFRFIRKFRLSNKSLFPRRPGSFYHACYDKDTEILTEKRGWVHFKDLTPKDKVATLDIHKDELVFQQPTNTFEYDYQGEMISITNRSVDLLITPNHRVFEYSNYTAPITRWRLTEAQDIYGKCRTMKRGVSNWEGVREDFILPSTIQRTGLYGTKTMPPIKIPILKWAKFFGWYITEGHCYKNSVVISQDAIENHEDIINCLKSLDRKPQTSRINLPDGTKKIKGFSIKHRQLTEYLKQFGLSGDKFIPSFLKNQPKDVLQVLLDTAIKGDGHNSPDRTNTAYYSKSYRLASDIQEIAIKCGYTATIGPNGDCYVVSITKNKTGKTQFITSPAHKTSHKLYNKVPYTGKVYCCEVPNSVILVRRNGKHVWSGNSKVASTYYIDLACRTWGLKATDIMQGIVFGAWTRESDDHDIHTRLDIDEAFGTVLNRFILQAYFGQPLTIFGSGDHQRGFLSLYDSIQCLNIALLNPPKESEYRTWNQLFLTLTMNQVADIVVDAAEYFGHNPDIKYIPSPRTEHTNEHYYNPETKILKSLGYIPNCDTKEAIRDEIWHIFDILKVHPPDANLINVIQNPKIKWR